MSHGDPKEFSVGSKLAGLIYFVCDKVRVYVFLTIQYPCYPYNELKERISAIQEDTLTKEVEIYESNSTKNKSVYRQLVLILLSSLCVLKLLAHPWLTVRAIDFDVAEFKNGSNVLRVDGDTVQVFCVQTNCTKFFSAHTEFTLDMRHFPLIPVCYPWLSRVSLPTVFMGPYGVLVSSLLAFWLFTTAVVMPSMGIIYSSQNDTLMFLFAPNLTRQLMISRAKAICEQINVSYKNYFRIFAAQEALKSHCACCPWSTYIVATADEQPSGKALTDSPNINQSHSSRIYDSSKFARACLPKVRTMGWHEKVSSVYINRYLILGGILAFESLVVNLDLIRRGIVASDEFTRYGDQMAQSRCAMWYDNVNQTLSLSSVLKVSWGLLHLVDTYLFCSLYLPLLVFVPVLIWLMLLELDCWRIEFLEQLKCIVEITRLHQDDCSLTMLYCKDVTQANNRHSDRAYDDPKRPAVILQPDYSSKLKDHTRSRYPLRPCHISTKLNGKIAVQRASLCMLSESRFTPEMYVQSMEKLYISFRLFIQSVKHCSDASYPLSITTYLLTYGGILITVWHSKLYHNFGIEHILMVSLCMLWSAYTLTVFSNFHAKVSLIDVIGPSPVV